MAEITVDSDKDLEWIADRAGDGDFSKRRYKDGKLYVDGVDQAALDAALADYDAEYVAPTEEDRDKEESQRYERLVRRIVVGIRNAKPTDTDEQVIRRILGRPQRQTITRP